MDTEEAEDIEIPEIVDTGETPEDFGGFFAEKFVGKSPV